MKLQAWKLRRLAAEAYLVGLAYADRAAIRGGTGPRDFRRVGVVSAVKRRNGIANGAKLQVEALRRAGVEAELLDATPALRNPFYRVSHEPATAYVFHSGGPQLASMISSVLPHAAAAWRVAYWAWELPSPPRQWPDAKKLVSELWTPSEFAFRSLAMRFDLPINVVPHVVLPAEAHRGRRTEQPFTVLTFADSRSSFERKNPAGAIRAFVRAFGDADAARLIVKLNGGGGVIDKLPREATSQANITIIDSFLDEEALQRLYSSADALLSLHRAEGFGLPMLEAMSMGIPVVATGWSGNLDFMNCDNSVLVSARQVPVQDDAVYSQYKNVMWAEPDELAAAAALRRLSIDVSFYDAVSKAAIQSAKRLCEEWQIPDQLGLVSKRVLSESR